ncbi:MAG: ABC transporter substrate-binding protein [Massiliimalia sp.]|jgi:multiple sugar transport system substrate-binding protein
MLFIKRTSVKAILAGLTALLFCASCQGGESSEGKASEQTNKTLSLSVESVSYTACQSTFDEYQKRYPEVVMNVDVIDSSSFQNFRSKLNSQLMAGEGPDLIFIGFNYFNDVDKLMKAGVFAPLDPFLEADEDFNRTDYVEPVLDAGVFDGTQYIMPLGYQYRLAVTTQQMIDETGFDTAASSAGYFGFVEQMDKLYENYPDRYVIANAGSLANFPNVMGVELFDYKNGKVLMDTPEMKQACEYYQKLYAQDNDNSRLYGSDFPFVASELHEKKSMLYFALDIGSVFELANEIGLCGDTPVMLPYPEVDGDVGSVCQFAMAIRANSQNQQNAYNMIDLFLEEDSQLSVSGGDLPVRKSALHQVVQMEYQRKNLAEDSAVTEEFANQYEQLASSVKSCHFTNHLVVSDFVGKKMKPYFLGEKSYEECMKDFVDYAEIYLSE